MMDNETIGYTPCWLAEMNGGRDRFRTCGLCRDAPVVGQVGSAVAVGACKAAKTSRAM
jgi:hypothetical protein